ncbi:hypothetical protein FEM48_Zijuj01G0029900 [Ziziphus jujuba var. spinosa]|uniref:Ycf3-interacting protein 1, chloroplastic n=1 Tax=Ziziphus jujuba var. spinosa TaxID=714518 RepID=A0A978VYR7_ZIZJJ|nr:hypothetical protein FEM48_Zijuj01G0029900 [Ziziphus jujuba var. spinosa]
MLQWAPISSTPSSSSCFGRFAVLVHCYHRSFNSYPNGGVSALNLGFHYLPTPKRRSAIVLAGMEDTELRASTTPQDNKLDKDDADPQDLEYVRQIKRVLELLRKNRDMLFSEVKLTIMIEDPREVERRRLLGIEDPDTPTREDLAEALEQVNEGKVPENRVALQVLAEEMLQWPNLEVEATKKKPSKSLYARATDTGIDPQEAARRLNVDWDTAAEIEDETKDDSEVPSVVV